MTSPVGATTDDRLAQLSRTVETLSRLHEAALDAITEAIHVAGREGADAAMEYLGDWCNDCDAVDDDAIASYDAYTVRRDAAAAELVSLRGQLEAATELAEVAVRQSSDQPNNDLLWARMMFAKKILAALGGAR